MGFGGLFENDILLIILVIFLLFPGFGGIGGFNFLGGGNLIFIILLFFLFSGSFFGGPGILGTSADPGNPA